MKVFHRKGIVFYILLAILGVSIVTNPTNSSAFNWQAYIDTLSLNDISPNYIPGGQLQQCLDGAGTMSSELSKNIPEEWGRIFSAAAEKYNINPNFLAAIYLTENGANWRPLDTKWPTSYAGARGPMQFLDGTWSAYKADGDGDGIKDVNNPYDAVFGTANYAKSIGLKADSALGSLTKPFEDRNSIVYVAISYNAGPGTTGSRSSGASLTSVSNEAQKYAKNIYAYFTSDFTKSDPSTGYGNPNIEGVADNSSISGGLESCNKSSNGHTIAEQALLLAETKEMDGLKTVDHITPAYKAAVQKYNPGDGLTPYNLTDCGRFVSIVMRSSGVDPDFEKVNVISIENYMRNSGKYRLVSPDKLEVGDIISYGGRHIFIYTGDLDPNGYMAVDASHHTRVPGRLSNGTISYMMGQSDLFVWRFNG